jgi:hypothetical protein
VIQNLFGIKGRKLIARWNQIDISDVRHPRLTCPRDELEKDSGLKAQGSSRPKS